MCSCALLWTAEINRHRLAPLINELMNEAVEIDPNSPDPKNNGRVVFMTGDLKSPDTVEDEYTKIPGLILLRRQVSMFQWAERSSPGGGPTYELGWFPGQIDFFSFKNPTGHENPVLKVEPHQQSVASATFGAFNGEVLLRYLKDEPIDLVPNLLKDPLGEIKDGRLIIRREGAGLQDSLGDMRLAYSGIIAGKYTVLAVQKNEHQLDFGISASKKPFFFARPGELELGELLETARQSPEWRLRAAVFVLLFIGIFSFLGPYAQSIDLRPRFNYSGTGAAVVISLAGALLIILVTVLLAWVGA